MTTLLDDLGDYLVTNGLGTWPNPPTTVGNLFTLMVPAPDICTIIQEYPGEMPLRTMGSGLPIKERPRVQIISRDPDYLAARTKARDIYRLFEQVNRVTINSHVYDRIEAVQSPFFLMEDESRRFLFACNYALFKDTE